MVVGGPGVWDGVGIDLKVEADAHDDERATLITDAPMALVVGTSTGV